MWCVWTGLPLPHGTEDERRDANLMRTRTVGIAVATLALIVGSGPDALAKPKAKKKVRPTTTAAPSPASTSGAARNFACTGTPNLKLAWRNVSGTLRPDITVSNVTVTQVWQKNGDAVVEQPTVVLTSPNPIGKHDLSSPLVVFRLNEPPPPATAADVDRLVTSYQLNLPDEMPVGPTFEGGLYFKTVKGAAGSLANEYRWQYVSSLVDGGAYTLNCTYT
jgi:hypothetical protein